MAYDGEIESFTKPEMDAEVRQSLLRARALVARGWCQEVFQQDRFLRPMQYCTVGAVITAAGAISDPVIQSLERAVRQGDVPEEIASLRSGALLMDWNDWPGRTKREVLEVFDRALA